MSFSIWVSVFSFFPPVLLLLCFFSYLIASCLYTITIFLLIFVPAASVSSFHCFFQMQSFFLLFIISFILHKDSLHFHHCCVICLCRVLQLCSSNSLCAFSVETWTETEVQRFGGRNSAAEYLIRTSKHHAALCGRNPLIHIHVSVWKGWKMRLKRISDGAEKLITVRFIFSLKAAAAVCAVLRLCDDKRS